MRSFIWKEIVGMKTVAAEVEAAAVVQYVNTTIQAVKTV
jgi:hypothetical protein